MLEINTAVIGLEVVKGFIRSAVVFHGISVVSLTCTYSYNGNFGLLNQSASLNSNSFLLLGSAYTAGPENFGITVTPLLLLFFKKKVANPVAGLSYE